MLQVGKSFHSYSEKIEYFVEFKNGKTVSPLKSVGKTNKTGTMINFIPSSEVFSFSTDSEALLSDFLATFMLALNVRQSHNDFFKPMIFPKNKRMGPTLLL